MAGKRTPAVARAFRSNLKLRTAALPLALKLRMLQLVGSLSIAVTIDRECGIEPSTTGWQ